MAHVNVLRAVTTPSKTYCQLEDGSFDSTARMLAGMSAGNTQPTFAALAEADFQFRATTTQLTSMLAEIPTPFGVDLSGGNVALYFLAAQNRGTRASGTVHQKFLATANTFACWNNISVAQGAFARAQMMWQPVWLGSTVAPVTQANNSAAPSVDVADEYFGLSKVVINGATGTGISGWTLNTGMSLEPHRSDGAVYAKTAWVNAIAPTVTFTLSDLDIWNSFGIAGTEVTEMILYLQRYKKNNLGFYAVDTNNHIKIEATSGYIHPDSARGGRGRADTQMTLTLTAEDEDADILTITTGTTIT